jgi:hypothetical protein
MIKSLQLYGGRLSQKLSILPYCNSILIDTFVFDYNFTINGSSRTKLRLTLISGTY